jgi:hypothetical protein
VIVLEGLIWDVKVENIKDLIKYTSAIGVGYVFSDHDNSPGTNIYAILRAVQDLDHQDE